MAQSGSFRAGMVVRAFYNMNDHPQGYRFVRMLDAGPPEDTNGPVASDPPTIGLSVGWMPATVAEDYDAATGGSEGVLVKFHGRFEDPYRMEKEPVNEMYWRVRPELMRAMSSPPTIELSLVVVRWRDYYMKDAGSKSFNILNETLIRDVLEGVGSPGEALGKEGSYEVFTVFACAAAHLDAVPQKVLASSLRGKRKAALYFVWPTQRPALERPKSGSVSEPSLRSLMTGLEAAGIRTCWPHPWTLYRELSGKRWASRLGTRARELKVPPTVTIAREALDRLGAPAAAASAIEQLQQLRREMGGEALGKDAYRGVVKLSFAWTGEAVLPFTGQAGLEKGLLKLLDGALPEAECLVQERVEGVRCEIRVFCCRDRAKGPDAYATETLRMRLHPPRHQALDASFALASHLTMTREDMALQVFGGDRVKAEAAEAEVNRLAAQWLEWFREHPGGRPHVCRVDFLLSVPAAGLGPGFEVHTCEITECGGSTCGLQVSTRTAATLNECMEDAEQPPVQGFPKPLPPLQQETRSLPSREARSPAAGATRVQRGGSRSRSTGKEEIQERRPRNSAMALAAVFALLLAQGQMAQMASTLRKRLPRLSVAVLAMGALVAVIARRLRQPLGSSQRYALTNQ